MAEQRVIERQRLLAATPEQILAHIQDLQAWRGWSPWEGLDPDLQREYSDPSSGVGATYQWSGNRKAGAGTMTIDAITDSSIDIDVRFTKPFPSNSTSVFTLRPESDGTLVVWQMLMPNSAVMRAFNLVFRFDKAIGGDLERGLDGLAAVVA